MERATEYYPLISAAARATGLPWWLIYGDIEQESGFDAGCIEAGSGALGLMQLMPSTFASFTHAQLLDPATNVRLGAEYLRECIAMWKSESPDEAIKFGLASYNGGSGYVLAAQRAAGAADQPTSQWQDVAPFLSQVECDGKRPDVEQITDYVTRIWTRFENRRELPQPEQQA